MSEAEVALYRQEWRRYKEALEQLQAKVETYRQFIKDEDIKFGGWDGLLKNKFEEVFGPTPYWFSHPFNESQATEKEA